MWEAYRTIDETLWRVSGRIRILKGVSPTQASIEEARERFFRSRQEGSRADVRLAYYPPLSDLGALESALEQADVPEGPLGPLYEAKRSPQSKDAGRQQKASKGPEERTPVVRW